MVDNKIGETSSSEMSQISQCPAVNSPHDKNCSISSSPSDTLTTLTTLTTINTINTTSSSIKDDDKLTIMKMNQEKTENNNPSYVSSCSESSSHSLDEDTRSCNEKNEQDNEVNNETNNNDDNDNNDNDNDVREMINHEATNDSTQFFIGESESNEDYKITTSTCTTTCITNDNIMETNNSIANTTSDSNIIIQEESQETLVERVKSLEAQLQSLTNLLTNILQSPQETMVSTSRILTLLLTHTYYNTLSIPKKLSNHLFASAKYYYHDYSLLTTRTYTFRLSIITM